MPKLSLQHLGHRGQAVGRAARVRDALQLRRELVVVHAQHAGQVGAVLRRGAEHDALGTGLQVRVVARLAVLRAGGEDAGAFDDHVDAQFLPGQLGRVADRQGLDLLAVDGQVLVVVLDRALEAAVGAVVLEQRGQHLVVGQVVDGDDLELAAGGHSACGTSGGRCDQNR